MGAISLKLPEDVLEPAVGMWIRYASPERRTFVAHRTHDRQTEAILRATRLAEASKKVRKESMRVSREFAAIEQAPDASSRRSVARQS